MPEPVPVKSLPDRGVIAVTAPATTPDPQALNRGIQYLESLGYRVEVGESCHKKEYYLAGSDDERAKELMRFFKDDKVDAIFCARGGHGSMRLLPLLDFEQIRRSRKLFVGFSDITALQWACYAKAGLPSWSAGMVATDMAAQPVNPKFEEHFWKAVHGEKLVIELPGSKGTATTIKASAIAGTASMAAKLLGTPFFPNIKDHIVVLEDVDEPTHKTEGYLLQLKLTGLFEDLQALLFGRFLKGDEQYPDVPSLEDILDLVAPKDKPLLRNVPYGHVPEKIPLPVGATISLSLQPETSTLTAEGLSST